MPDDTDLLFDDLPSASAALHAAEHEDTAPSTYLGHTLESSRQGIVVQLAPEVDPESVYLGSYAVVGGSQGDYLAMVDDVGVFVERLPVTRRIPNEKGMATLRRKGAAYAQLHLTPHLRRQTGSTAWEPARTVPTFLRPVRSASQEEISSVFGAEDKGHLVVGQPLDMDTVNVTVDLAKLAQRSTGVFGRAGTGKSFMARTILAGMIKAGTAVHLIFDMHNEYGWEGSSEGATSKVKGLKQLFPAGQVAIFTLDDESSRRRKSNPDFTVQIPFSAVEPEDLETLQTVLDLSEAQIGAIYVLSRRLGKTDKDWLANFLDDAWLDSYSSGSNMLDEETGLKALATDTQQPIQTLAALRRKLDRFRRYGFLKRKASDDSVDRILRSLDAGQSIVLEFGRYGNDLDAYIFVANYLTRRIHDRYVQKKEKSFGDQTGEPTPLVITIEEAHKFLDPAIAKHTIFGTIAREMRKYNVTLFIVDQRPSQIDAEVMSQMGTRITLSLSDPNDISAVFNGVMGADALRDVLARLDTRQQAMILGHAVPIPVVIRTRPYDLAFYKAMGWQSDEELVAGLAARTARMRGAPSDGFD